MIDIIKDYDCQPAFADFLPGIAGENGIPAWCFFVNRGQGVASFGTQDKDHPIMEFRPAHTAWQDVQAKGFRTFLKYHGHVSELFVNARDKQMLLGANSLTLHCRETDAPVRAQVQYFILPNACVGALARALTIENTDDGVLDLEVLDNCSLWDRRLAFEMHDPDRKGLDGNGRRRNRRPPLQGTGKSGG